MAATNQEHMDSTPDSPSLPEVPGAKIDRSNLIVGDSGVLVHYISSDVDYHTATRAIIVVHGLQRDANNSFVAIHKAVETANESNVVIMAPVFFNGYDKGKFPWDGKATSNQLVWKGNEWCEGGNNQYPTKIPGVSSFDALDAAIAYFTDKKRFPMIKNIILAGHSAGGQTVQRYIILSDDPPESITFRSVIANAGSYTYFSPNRFKPVPDDCTGFNNWKYGLENCQLTYRAYHFAHNASSTHLPTRYLTRQVRYLYGTADLGAEDQGCAAKTQGANHYERGQLFWKHITESYPGPWVDSIQKVAYVEGVRHNEAAMWKSKEGQAAFFLVVNR